ncbi:MAG: cytochrome P450 [Alphaproteobacteria bacterium]|nr:cytochrome P450 [Alphaproteobacteria bacterium]
MEDFKPPRPSKLPAVLSLLRTVWRGDGDLLSLLPGEAFSMKVGELGFSRRSIKLFNDPDLVRTILQDTKSVYPKSDLMVGALEPLIGDSIFVSDGEKWRRQRAMIDPAFSKMRLSLAFGAMQAAVADHSAKLADAAGSGAVVSLDQVMSELTADIICRTVFSTSLDARISRDVFEDFAIFERGVAQVKIWRLIVDPAWSKVRQEADVLAACARIRSHLGELIDAHIAAGPGAYDDIASEVIAARDADTGEAFTREELIDQLGVFFLAGHETTASALTWAFYILARWPRVLARLREEVAEVAGEGEITFEAVRKMVFARSIFRETLRLYPPITFMPRVALEPQTIGVHKVRKGALLMISPWTLQRHQSYWTKPDVFDPDRFMPGREADIQQNAYIPFGAGPHTCIGAGFAAVEAVLILAGLARRFDFELLDPHAVRPAARLTTRPAEQIRMTVRPHEASARAG